jgi:hypothetical protein
LFGKKKEEIQTKLEKGSKTKKTLFVTKFFSAELAKEHMEKYGRKKSGTFLMHERDLPQYPWIKKAIVDLECAVPLGLSEQEIKQFHEMSGSTSTIILPVTHNGLHARVIYLLKLV